MWDKGEAPELECRERGPSCLSVPVKGIGWLCPCAVFLTRMGLDLPHSTAHSVL